MHLRTHLPDAFFVHAPAVHLQPEAADMIGGRGAAEDQKLGALSPPSA